MIPNSHRMEYLVVVHKAEEGGFQVQVPALPGCYSQGESIPEALENVKEAIALYLETLRASENIPTFIEHLLDIPKGDDDFEFERIPLSLRSLDP